MKAEQAQKSVMRRFLNFIYVVAILAILAGVYLPPTSPNLHAAMRSASMQTARSIELCLHQYANDHNGHYPEGKTSTEVFQHLIDEKYVADPNIFYVRFLRMSGKVQPQDTHLKAENVSWDVTYCVDSSSPNSLPVVFLTGYKVTYQAGAPALPLPPGPPPAPKTWYEWIFGPSDMKSFIAVCYKDDSAKVIMADDGGSIPDFIPVDFDPKGKTYRQLTP